MKELKGTFVVMVTPFTEKEQVDFEGFERNIDFYLENGIHGLLPLGSTGEFASLTEAERFKVVEFVVKKTAGRVPVCVGTATETTAQAIEYSKHALKSGADAVMILQPYYMKPSQEEMIYHFEQIAENVDIPIMLYNNPWTSGVDLELESVLKLAEKENIRYVKESTGDIRRLRDIKNQATEKITTICGWDDLALESFFHGAMGWVSVVANFLPREAAELFEAAVVHNDYQKARKIYNKILPLCIELETCGKLVQLAKYCLSRRKSFGGNVRAPRLPLEKEYCKKIDQMLEELGVL